MRLKPFRALRPRTELAACVASVPSDVVSRAGAVAPAAGTPLYDFATPDGVRHTVWMVPDATPWVQAFDAVPLAYVADGHHRSASAWRAGREQRAANPRHSGNEEYNWFLAVLFPSDQL